MKKELLAKCGDIIAAPLTTGDQYDVSRALSEANEYAKKCRARQSALVDAVEAREQLMLSVKQQLEKK